MQRGNARAFITVRNGGGDANGTSVVEWRPYAGNPGVSTSVPGLKAGRFQTVTFDSAYPNPGNFDAVAITDVSDSLAETNEGNNSRTLRVTVQPARARVVVEFTQVNVHDDAGPHAAGQLWLDFNVRGTTGRWPSSGTRSVDSNGTYDVNKSFEVTLTEGEKLISM